MVLVFSVRHYLFLQQQIKRNDRLVWFAIDAIANGEIINGKIAYIKALLEDFGNDPDALTTELSALPDSFKPNYLFEPQKYGLTLLIGKDQPVLSGVLGKEKQLDVVLTPGKTALLLGLAAHLRGFEFVEVAENITFHPFGWIDVNNNPALQTELMQLSEIFKETDLIIENHHDVLFRLSINSDVVYFDEKLFSYSVNQADLTGTKTKIPVIIKRNALATALGTTEVKSETFKVTLEFAHKLLQLSENQFSADNEAAVKIEDAYKKSLHREPKFMDLGLRSLIRREAGIIRFCCKLEVLPKVKV